MCFSHLALHQPWIQENNKTPVSMTLAPAADGPRPPDLARAHCRLPAQGGQNHLLVHHRLHIWYTEEVVFGKLLYCPSLLF